MQSILKIISEQGTLSRAEAERAMGILLRGEAGPDHVAALLMGLRARGETLDELTGFTHTMRSHAVSVALPHDRAVDIVGTGGDGFGTFNISTAAAIVCAAAGATVAKHGSRSASSKCGSAEVLEELGVNIDLGKAGVEFCLDEAGLAFMYAPHFHPAMRHVMPVRRSLGVRTCFNILGPLCNPAGVKRYLLGAFTLDLAQTMAGILTSLGADRVVTVHSDDGMDEISISEPTTLFMCVGDGRTVSQTRLAPEDVGLDRAPMSQIIGGGPKDNAEILVSIFEGVRGAQRDIVVLNAGVALFAAGIVGSIGDGVELAGETIDSGRAKQKLSGFIDVSQRAKSFGKTLGHPKTGPPETGPPQ